MIPITDQELDDIWRATIDNEIARHDWCEIMQEAQAEAMLQEATRHLGLMVLAMTGGEDYERLIDTVEYIDDIEEREWHARGAW